MTSASLLRAQLEASLAQRAPGAFTLKTIQAPELYPSGIAKLDDLLGGGLPRSGITEITGNSTTGKTTIALSLLGRMTAKGAVGAWVDVQDSLDPETAAAHGICLERLLWLRLCGKVPVPVSSSRQGGLLVSIETPQQTGDQHSRNEMRAMDNVASQAFRGKGKSGPYQAGPSLHRKETERVSGDRQHLQRAKVAPERWATRVGEETTVGSLVNSQLPARTATARPQPRLKDALTGVDLLLQAGGFGAIVLDMSDVRSDLIIRIATSHWYRFRLAAEQAQATLILLTQTPCAKSCASLLLHCSADLGEPWQQEGETALFTTVRYKVAIERQRYLEIDPALKKSVVRVNSAEWRTQAQWAR
jgi:recombination protein RecA